MPPREGLPMSPNLPGFFQGTEMPVAGWWEALWPDPFGVLTTVGAKVGMDAIDLCAGDGWFTLQMARLARHVVAIDLDAALLEVARARLREEGISNCDFRAGDAYQLASLAPQPVDFVFMANAFHGVPDRPRLARIVREVLHPNGRFAIVNWHPFPREQTPVLGEPRGPATGLRLSPPQTIKDVTAGGLVPVGVVDIGAYHYGALFTRAP
jgi:SAM-dependent methyltransferase